MEIIIKTTFLAALYVKQFVTDSTKSERRKPVFCVHCVDRWQA